MAETKKKSTAKKTVKKPVSKKKTETKKHAVSSKATKSDSKKVKESKKVEKTEEVEEESISNNNNMIIIGILIALVLILGGAIIYLVMNNTSNSNVPVSNNNSDVVSNMNSSDEITLTILEDPTCTDCNVDEFANQVKKSLIPNLKVNKISIETKEGKQMLSTLNLNQVPTYLFSENIDKRSDWASKLSAAFVKVQLGNKNSYMLNPQYVPNKVMITAPKILNNTIVYGNKSAKITIYEFSDYECPFCGIAEGNKDLVAQFSARQPGYVPPMPEVFKNYIDTGKVKLVFYNMPLTQIHPKVRPAHIAALCANEQGKWIEFHHKLFADRSDWAESSDYNLKMRAYAKELGLDTTKFDACLISGKYDAQLDREIAYGQSLGVSGTPAFFIDKNFLSGAQDFSKFKEIIDAKLAALK